MDYPDNAERFIFFSKAVVNLARYLPWRPDVVHVHDWQTALAPVFMLEQKLHDGWTAPPPVCLTIHNLSYQGNFPRRKIRPDQSALELFPDRTAWNFMAG